MVLIYKHRYEKAWSIVAPKWFVRQLMKICRRMETVIGQLVGCFEVEHTRYMALNKPYS